MRNIEQLSNAILKATKHIESDKNSFIAKEKTIKAFKKLGFTMLAGGSERTVYVSSDGKYVVKIDRNKSQNMYEIEIYAKIPKDLQKYFLKPIAYDKEGFMWILTHRAKNWKDLGYKKASKIACKLNRIFEKKGLHASDLHGANVGTFKGKSVMLDYGYPIGGKAMLGGDN